MTDPIQIVVARYAKIHALELENADLRKQLATAREYIQRRDRALKAAKTALVRCGGFTLFRKLVGEREPSETRRRCD